MEFSLKDISAILNGEVIGDETVKVNHVGKIEEAGIGAISFLSNPKYENHIYDTNASAVIVSEDFEPKKEINTSLIKVKDPYTSFTTLLEEYSRLESLKQTGVEEPSFVKDNAKIGEGGYRGAFSYIGDNCLIGDNVKIYPYAYIGDNVHIGDNTIIHPGVKIYKNCAIGSHCTIHANAVIGSDGFGFAPQEDGSYKTIPQIGNVVLEDHVCIGANTVIDCATMGSTIIHEGVKLDNLIQVAHNVEIGKHTVIAAQAGISGSTKIGDYCTFGGQVGIGGHIKIADKTALAAKTGVIKSIKKSGEVLVGQPGIDVKKYFKSYAVYKNLPEILKRIEQLEEKVINLRPE